MGAGLGGGSADGAFMLQLLNDKYKLNLTTVQLINYALQLGSDCPFFIVNKPCYATGRGEQMEPVGIDLSAYQLVLANPGIHISTGWAFSQVHVNKSLTKHTLLKDTVMQPVDTWQQHLVNDFENPVFEKYPYYLYNKTHYALNRACKRDKQNPLPERRR